MAIIGNGNIARVLNDREGAIFFASGISNSSIVGSSNEWERERVLLKSQPRDLCLFYFSSIGIYTCKKDYYLHKINMEWLVIELFPNYNIIRLGNISWDTNPNTFLNFIRNKIAKGEPVEIRNEYRYMIDKEDLLAITDTLPLVGQRKINVFSRMAKVKDLI